MYYKIENKECEVYKKLHALRTSEIEMNKDNLNAVVEKVVLDFRYYVGTSSQQNFFRTVQFSGFMFTDPTKVDTTIWKEDKKKKGYYFPNKRTKTGREMAEFLLNGLKKTCYDEVFKILNLPHLARFVFPYVEIAGEMILVAIDEKQEPKDPNLIEITKREFEQIFSQQNGF